MAPQQDKDNGRKDAVNVNQMHAAILREQSEPEDGYEALPTAWLLGMLCLALVAGWYFGTYSGDFSPNRLDGEPMQMLAAQSETATPKAPSDPKLVGKRIYNNCMACHQGDGKGVAGQFPPLAHSEWVLGKPEALARILLHGLQGPVVVLNKSYDGVMPAWSRFGDEDIAAVLTYIRASFGNQAPPIAPEVIAAARKSADVNRGPWSQAEFHALGMAP